MKLRIVLTILVLSLGVLAHGIYHYVESPVAGVATANQLNDTVAASGTAKFIAEGGIDKSILIVMVVLMVPIWMIGSYNKTTPPLPPPTALALLIGCALLFTGCMGPPKVLDVENIAPNETCWVIPLDAQSQSSQTKFDSIGYLEQKKVPVKRVMVDKVERSTGRFYWEYEWIPAVRVIKVDRSLVTREWTETADTGTTGKKEGIKVITKDSIKLTVGLTITANINEEDASTYLYYHGEKKLADVVDQNVRSFAVSELTRKFGELTLEQAQTQANTIYADLFKDAAVAFKSKGITVQYLGNAEGMHYDDPTIQLSINQSYTSAQDKKTAQQQQEATEIRNKTKIMIADAEAQAAQKLLAAKDATMLKNTLEIRLIEANARMAMATNWNGKLPTSLLPANSPLLLSLGISPADTVGTNAP